MPALSPLDRPRLGWGLLGTGAICEQLAQALAFVPEARLVAVGSRTVEGAQAFAQACGAAHAPVRAHGSYQALVDDPEVDIVYIGTPHPDHAPSMKRALQAGKAVLCEKPFTVRRREAEEVVALARRRGVFLMEAMWMRYVPAMVELQALIAAGAIGEVIGVSADFGFATGAFDPAHRVLAPGLAGGGLLDIGIYPLNFAAFVLGPITSAQATAEIGPTGVDVHTTFQLVHTGGGRSQGLCSLRATSACRATVLGSAGRIEVEPPFYAGQRLHLVRGTQADSPTEIIDRPWRGTRYVAQVEEVQRCLRAGLAESPVMPLEESIALMGWLDAMRAQVGLRYPGE